MLQSLDVNDYMLHNPLRIGAEADIFDAVQLILDHKVSGLCVVDSQNVLVGVLSELDCLDAILSVIYEGSGRAGKVSDYMTPVGSVVCASLSEDIVDIARDMVRNKRRRRPVVQDGKLVGQITCRQLLRAVRDFSALRPPARAANG